MGEMDVRVTMIWIHQLFSEALWTSMTEDFFNFRGEMCTYYVLCNISLWGLGQHPLIKHINISAGEYMNIPTKWGKCEIKTSGQVSSVITLDQIMVATWLSFGFQWFCIAGLWGRDCGPADQCKSLPFIESLSRVQLFATPWTEASQASLSFTVSQSWLKLMTIESMMSPNNPTLCHPLLLPSSFPAPRSLGFLCSLVSPAER